MGNGPGGGGGVGKSRTLIYHLHPEVEMANHRFMFFGLVITLGLSFLGCSQSPASNSRPQHDEKTGRETSETSNQPRGNGQWWLNESIASQIELGDDQVRAIEKMMDESLESIRQQRQRERQLSLRYLRTLAQDPYDAELATEISERLAEVLSDKYRVRIQRIRALRDILDETQWEKLWELAPQALRIDSFRILRGPKISVTDSGPSETSAPSAIPAP